MERQKDELIYAADHRYRIAYEAGYQDGVIQERSEGATREAYLQGIEEQKMKQWEYRWHDLRKNPNDLPEGGEDVIYVFLDEDGKKHTNTIRYFEGVFDDTDIAWKSFEPFQEEGDS